jgi:hypothetical protein
MSIHDSEIESLDVSTEIAKVNTKLYPHILTCICVYIHVYIHI